jgi:hypothetical protein
MAKLDRVTTEQKKELEDGVLASVPKPKPAEEQASPEVQQEVIYTCQTSPKLRFKAISKKWYRLADGVLKTSDPEVIADIDASIAKIPNLRRYLRKLDRSAALRIAEKFKKERLDILGAAKGPMSSSQLIAKQARLQLEKRDDMIRREGGVTGSDASKALAELGMTITEKAN